MASGKVLFRQNVGDICEKTSRLQCLVARNFQRNFVNFVKNSITINSLDDHFVSKGVYNKVAIWFNWCTQWISPHGQDVLMISSKALSSKQKAQHIIKQNWSVVSKCKDLVYLCLLWQMHVHGTLCFHAQEHPVYNNNCHYKEVEKL